MLEQQSDSNDEIKKDGEFLVPKIPAFTTNKPQVNLKDIKNRSINYINKDQQEEQTTESVKKFPPALTKFYPKPNLFYLEIIKDGISIEKHYLNKNVTILGRSLDCDLIFEHYSISRYHAAFYWKDGLDDDGFFYLTDLNSSHGTFLNKTKIEQNKFLKLQPNQSFIKIGASTRLIIFNKIEDEEEENSEIYSDPDVVNKRHNIQVADDSCSWGLNMDDELNNDLYADSSLQIVLNIINDNQLIDKTDNENAYSQNPQKAISNWFDYEGYEFEYTIQTDNNKFKCTIDFPIDHQYVPITGDEDIKKKDAINKCCLKACRILDKAGILFSWQKNNKINKRQKDSDEEDNDLIDETGERESKKQRLEAMKTKKVENLESLTDHLEELKKEIKKLDDELEDMDKELLKNKTGNNSKDKLDDELDQYVKDVSTTSKFSINDLKIRKSQFKMKISKLLKEKERTEKLIKIAQPSLSLNNNIKLKNVQTNNSCKINELIQKAQEKLSQKKKEDIEMIELDKEDSELKKAFQEDDNSNEQSKKALTFNKSKMLLKPNSTFNLEEDEYEKKKRPIIRLDDDDELLETQKKIEKPKSNQNIKEHTNKIINSRDAEEEIEDDDKIIEWLPPEESDFKSNLNDKYGY